MPSNLAKIYAAIVEKTPRPPISRDLMIRFALDNVVDTSKPNVRTLADLGIEPHSLREVAPFYLKRFRKHGGNPDPIIYGE